jgi:para-nitrobenzyl esterase
MEKSIMSPLSRREFITRVPLAAAGAMALGHAGYCFSQTADVIVEIAHGKLRGLRENGVNIFKGIPYAGRISGGRRFLAPAPLAPWPGIRDALRLGHPSIQNPHSTYGLNEPEPDEECLVLNVWTPANDNSKRPVMFYNHGGGYTGGSGGSVAQDGANLARLFDVVVVQTNHRLGLLGYLYLDKVAGEEYAGSGNRGVLDIVEGLKWVRENIARFGGDPDNVMIFGESGGGAKTSCLYALPAAAPYFNKASIESGPGVRMAEAEVAAETTWMLLKALGIDAKGWRKLLDLPAADLLAAQGMLQMAARTETKTTIGIGSAQLGEFGPVVDGQILPAHPFDPVAPAISRDKPLMVGWNEDEYTFFGMISGDTAAFKLDETGLKKRLESEFGAEAQRIFDTYRRTRPQVSYSAIYVAIKSMLFAGTGSIRIAEKKAEQNGAPAFLYNFGYKTEFKIPGTEYAFGSGHAMDIQFKFANVAQPPPGELEKGWPGNRPERFAAMRNMAGMWTSFARAGVPAVQGQPEWPPYSLAKRPAMRIDSQCEVILDRYGEERQLWDALIRN